MSISIGLGLHSGTVNYGEVLYPHLRTQNRARLDVRFYRGSRPVGIVAREQVTIPAVCYECFVSYNIALAIGIQRIERIYRAGFVQTVGPRLTLWTAEHWFRGPLGKGISGNDRRDAVLGGLRLSGVTRRVSEVNTRIYFTAANSLRILILRVRDAGGRRAKGI